MVPPSNTTSLEGSRVKLTCQAEGFPDNITYRWYRDGVDVQQIAALMTRAGIYADGSFVINSVQTDDVGWYTCRPTNGLGVPPEASAFLDVTCEFMSFLIAFISFFFVVEMCLLYVFLLSRLDNYSMTVMIKTTTMVIIIVTE